MGCEAQILFIELVCVIVNVIRVVLSLCFSDGPIVTEEELTSLPLVKVIPDGHYTSANLNTIVRMMKGLLEQKVPLQEFEVQKLYYICIDKVYSLILEHFLLSQEIIKPL